MSKVIFEKINNSVLDLQASHYQSYQNELKKLARLLSDECLKTNNAKLIENVNLEEFLEKSYQTQGGMVGSAHLIWPDNDSEALGLKYLLIQKLGSDANFTDGFCHTYYYVGKRTLDHVQAMVRNLIIPFIRDYKLYFNHNTEIKTEVQMPITNNKVFIVHGHDDNSLNKVARFIERIGLEAIILHEQANGGRTIIEKIEAHSEVGFAVVLLTPDDLGKAKTSPELVPRARQNVILELGYFLGKIGRNRVCAMKSDEIEIPTDFMGVVWTNLDPNESWKFALTKELKEAGYNIDISKLF